MTTSNKVELVVGNLYKIIDKGDDPYAPSYCWYDIEHDRYYLKTSKEANGIYIESVELYAHHIFLIGGHGILAVSLDFSNVESLS